MRKISSYLAIILMSFTAISQLHAEKNAGLHAAIKAFDDAYTNNDVESYFNSADDATVYVGGEVRVDMELLITKCGLH